MFSLVFKNKRPKNYHRKIHLADLNSPRQELFNGGLGIVVTLLVRRQIDFSCSSRWSVIKLYTYRWIGHQKPSLRKLICCETKRAMYGGFGTTYWKLYIVEARPLVRGPKLHFYFLGYFWTIKFQKMICNGAGSPYSLMRLVENSM